MKIDQAARPIIDKTSVAHDEAPRIDTLGVKNVSNTPSHPASATAATVPSLTLLHNNGSKQTLEFSTQGFDAPIRNGVIYNGRFTSAITEKYTQDKIQPHLCLVKDGALSIDIPRFRTSTGGMTKTQQILSDFLANKPVSLERLIHDDATTNLDREERLQMVNDPTRRVFESYYAKYALEKLFSNPELCDKFHQFSTTQADFIKQNYCTPEIIVKFDAAFRGEEFSFDSQLGGFYDRIQKSIDTLNIGDEAKSKLKDIYLNRYLNLALRNDDTISKKMPEGHWHGIFDFFKAPGKGRVEIKVKEGDMFRQADSHAVGILRNFDASPADLRLNEPYSIQYEADYKGKLTAGKSTRCPDRLEIQDPMHPDAMKDGSYVKELFGEGVGTYVNGPSGTILIEHGAIRACKELHQDKSADDLAKFLELQGLLFIYVDGGHSMHEISRALTDNVASTKLQETFDQRPEFGAVGQSMFRDKDALTHAAQSAAIFDHALRSKDQIHAQLQAVQNRIDS